MNKKYLLGLAVMVIIFFGLYYLSTSNKLSPNPTPSSQRDINFSASEIKTSSGLLIRVIENQIEVKNPEGITETYIVVEDATIKKMPHPRLVQEGKIENPKELIITLNDLKINDKLAIDTIDGKNAQGITVFSENPADFQ